MVISYLTPAREKTEGQLDTVAQEYIHYAIDGGKRMKELIDDLLHTPGSIPEVRRSNRWR